MSVRQTQTKRRLSRLIILFLLVIGTSPRCKAQEIDNPNPGADPALDATVESLQPVEPELPGILEEVAESETAPESLPEIEDTLETDLLPFEEENKPEDENALPDSDVAATPGKDSETDVPVKPKLGEIDATANSEPQSDDPSEALDDPDATAPAAKEPAGTVAEVPSQPKPDAGAKPKVTPKDKKPKKKSKKKSKKKKKKKKKKTPGKPKPPKTPPTAPQPTEPKPAEPQPVEPKPVEPVTEKPQPVEPEPVETKPAEPEPVETKPVEPEPVETKPVEPEPVETEPVEPVTEKPVPVVPEIIVPKTAVPLYIDPQTEKPIEPKPVEPQTEKPKPVEPQTEKPKPPEPKPVEPEPEKPKPVDPQPVKPKPVEPKPVQPKPQPEVEKKPEEPVTQGPCIDVYTTAQKRQACPGAWKEQVRILNLQVNKLEKDNEKLWMQVTEIHGKIKYSRRMISESHLSTNAWKKRVAFPHSASDQDFKEDVKDCNDALGKGNEKPGVYLLNPSSPYNVRALCVKGWTVIQRRFDGTENFNRDFDDYIAGFGNFSGEFFLGLENLHRLAKNKAYTLRVDVKGASGKWYYGVYEDFSLTDETDEYRLLLGNMTEGNYFDGFDNGRDQQFSTPDRDNDEWRGGNCAEHYGGGWWSSTCSTNLNQMWCRTGCLRWASKRVVSSIMRIKPSEAVAPEDLSENPNPAGLTLDETPA